MHTNYVAPAALFLVPEDFVATPLTFEMTTPVRPLRVPQPHDRAWGSRAKPRQWRTRKPGEDFFKQISSGAKEVLSTHDMASCDYYARLGTCRAAETVFVRRGSTYPRFSVSPAISTSSSGQTVDRNSFIAWHRPHLNLLTQYAEQELHPAVTLALKITRPASFRVLLMHWPRMSEEKPGELIYASTYDKAARNLWTRTSPGKYLRAMFPDLRDEEIAEIVAQLGTGEREFGIATEMDTMLAVLHNGPKSCMTGPADAYDSYPHHPYEVYDPRLGWAMAYMRTSSLEKQTQRAPEYYSRALVHTQHRCFVRTYKYGGTPDSYSHACERLEAWLKLQGFTKRTGWLSGTQVLRIESERQFVAPYVDGDNNRVYAGRVDYLTLGYTQLTQACVGTADSTCGLVGSSAETYTCECCDDVYDEDHNWHWVGDDGETRICRYCYEREYMHVTGRRGRTYIVHNDDAVHCESDGEYYDRDYLDDNDVAQCEATDDYFKLSDMFECDYSGDKYNDQQPHFVLANGLFVHNDNAKDYFSDNPDELVAWWCNGQCTGGDDDCDVDAVINEFCDDVENGHTELDGAEDWRAYREMCANQGRDPIACDEGEDERVNADAETNETTEE